MGKYGVKLALAILIIEMVIYSAISSESRNIIFEQTLNQIYYIADSSIALKECIDDCNKQYHKGTMANIRCVKECLKKH
ncbi:hypothetical protein AAHE18_01G028300 [Arachis hypogaea]